MTTAAVINTNEIPLNKYYLKVKHEIDTNPVTFWDRYNPIKKEIIKAFRGKGYSKRHAEQLMQGVERYYLVYSRYYNGQPLNPGALDIARLENEVNWIITRDHDDILEYFWNPYHK